MWSVGIKQTANNTLRLKYELFIPQTSNLELKVVKSVHLIILCFFA